MKTPCFINIIFGSVYVSSKLSLFQKAKEEDFQLSFRHWLPWDLLDIWQHIQSLKKGLCFRRTMMLSPGSSTKMAVSPLSLYKALTLNEAGNNYTMLWKGRIPAKSKSSYGSWKNNVVLTKDNLIKRQGSGMP